jgi:hypothetical protein
VGGNAVIERCRIVVNVSLHALHDLLVADDPIVEAALPEHTPWLIFVLVDAAGADTLQGANGRPQRLEVAIISYRRWL